MPKFSDVKYQVIQCLVKGSVLYETRGDIDIKNLLQVGAISLEEVTDILKQSRGNDFGVRPYI
jgi:hypothetical protein